jgi:ubiquinone/menaquinone biosynthesis C-methylase UbiE
VPESALSTARLTRFYGEMSPTVETVKEALAVAGVDPEHPRASDLYQRDIDCHNLGMFPMVQLVASVAAEYTVPSSDDVVLDVGCGLGGPSRYLADQFGCSVVGIDLLPLRVEIAQQLAALTGSVDRVSYRVADATALDFDDASFAHVWMLDVSMHIRDKRALFDEIARVLRPDGLMVMHEQTGPLPAAMGPARRQAPYIAPALPQLIRYIEDAQLRMLTWRDTTTVALHYFLGMRDLLLGTSEPVESRRKTGVPILDGYLETFTHLNGRTGVLVARRR